MPQKSFLHSHFMQMLQLMQMVKQIKWGSLSFYKHLFCLIFIFLRKKIECAMPKGWGPLTHVKGTMAYEQISFDTARNPSSSCFNQNIDGLQFLCSVMRETTFQIHPLCLFQKPPPSTKSPFSNSLSYPLANRELKSPGSMTGKSCTSSLHWFGQEV